MPLMDGFQFLDEFEKLNDNTKKKCRIVMLTSSINPQDFNRSKKYDNVKLYLNKPLSHDSIQKLSV
jgi:CheY-like chemotaxis protein